MGWFERQKPALVMSALQLGYSAQCLLTRDALLHGMSSMVFIFYRHIIATLVIAPFAIFSHKRKKGIRIGRTSFCMIFLASLIGVTANQNFYFQGLYYSSSSTASAMCNLIPAITFLMAASMGLEKIELRSLKSMAKILGTGVCVSGALCMTFFKGSRLQSKDLHFPNNGVQLKGDNWLMGCLLVLGSSCCCSVWLILQVKVSESYPDHLGLTAWMCFITTLQSGVVAFIFEPDLNSWVFNTKLEISSCFYTAIIGSVVAFYVQSWCVSKRGPLFAAMFNPLSTVIITILACPLLNEKLYIGSLAGGGAVVVGLYIVLWGKSEDIPMQSEKHDIMKMTVSEEESSRSCVINSKLLNSHFQIKIQKQ